MLIDEIFADRKLFDIILSSPKDNRFYLGSGNATTEQLFNTLRTAQVFHVDNVRQYLTDKGKASWEDLPNIRMPYPVMWFESKVLNPCRYTYPDGLERHINKTGTLLLDFGNKDGRRKMIAFCFASTREERTLEMGGWIQFYCDEDGNPLTGWDLPILEPGEVITDTELTEMWMMNLAIPLFAISFMHCKNVSITENKIPEVMQTARRRRGKPPLIGFHTLEIKPLTKILHEEGDITNTGLKKALHICRGHFKDFSKGNGLFGKYRGLYWWEFQVRGSEKEGVSLKDYKISP